MAFTEIFLKVELIDGVKVLFLQLLLGNGFHVNAPLWYMVTLIWITVFYSLLFRIVSNKRYAFLVIILFSVICLIQQYFGIALSLFGDLSFELKYPLGRFFEMVPSATVGILLGYWFRTHQIKGRNVIWTASVAIAISWILISGTISRPEGFGYSGISLILVSSALFLVAELFPLEQGKCNRVIRALTMHTLGVYCMHYLIGNVLDIALERFGYNINRFLLCIMIYIIAYVFGCIIFSLPWQQSKQLVD